jgi:hypothetical protein
MPPYARLQTVIDLVMQSSSTRFALDSASYIQSQCIVSLSPSRRLRRLDKEVGEEAGKTSKCNAASELRCSTGRLRRVGVGGVASARGGVAAGLGEFTTRAGNGGWADVVLGQ